MIHPFVSITLTRISQQIIDVSELIIFILQQILGQVIKQIITLTSGQASHILKKLQLKNDSTGI
jgi:hypothetical protein